MRQPSPHPTRKMTAVMLAGAFTTLLAWLLSLGGVEMPPEVATAVTTIIVGAAGYLTEEPLR